MWYNRAGVKKGREKELSVMDNNRRIWGINQNSMMNWKESAGSGKVWMAVW